MQNIQSLNPNSVIKPQLFDELTEEAAEDKKYLKEPFVGSDITTASYVASKVLEINTGAFHSRSPYKLGETVDHGLELLYDVDKASARLVKEKLDEVPIVRVKEEPDALKALIDCPIDLATGLVDKEGIVAKAICVPELITNVTDVFLGHEFIHICKDTNYDEFKLGNRLADVIPLFYELVCLDRVDFKRELVNTRINFLKENIAQFNLFRDLQSKNPNLFAAASYVIGNTGQYLNSFYYALLLYNLYREMPARVLVEVRNVLYGTITTAQMLSNLKLSRARDDEKFDEEVILLAKRMN